MNSRVLVFLAAVGFSFAMPAVADDDEFYRGINVNGGPVRIDGRPWQGDRSPQFKSNDVAVVAEGLQLRPNAEGDLAAMLRSFRWSREAHLRIIDVPKGTYSVAFYLLEDTQPQRFDVQIESLSALDGYESGPAGTWRRVGPWTVEVTDGTIDITSRGGDANFCGIEIWKGTTTNASKLRAKKPPVSPLVGRFADQKPRIVVMTDIGGDPDDQQSFVRFLLYTCDFDVEGICTGFGHGHYQNTRPDLLHRGVDAYAKAFENLRRHRPGFPTPELLRSLIKDGHNGDPHLVGPGMDSEASNWIIHVLEEDDPRPVWFSIWGGPRELAQAIWRMDQSKSKEELARIKQKIHVHSIADQDRTAGWVKQHHPDVFWIYSQDVFRGIYAGGDPSLVSPEWLRQIILGGHGPLGDVYPPDAAGKKGVKEGDTPSFLYVVRNGLSDPQAPSWGNWGGRFRYRGGGTEYVDAVDSWKGEKSSLATVYRWREAFQNELETRMDWCVQPPSKANHAPTAVCNGHGGVATIEIEAASGSNVILDAAGSHDPDRDDLAWNWWVYPEPSGLSKDVPIENARARQATLRVPDQVRGQTLHVILEVTDSGQPSLTSYRRVLIHCR